MAAVRGSEKYTIFHLRHPRPMPFSLIMECFSRILNIPVVPYTQWLSIFDRALAGWDLERVHNFSSILGIVAFLRSHRMGDVRPASENGGLSVLMGMEESCRRCLPLQRASVVDFEEDEVRRWVQYWKEVGAIPTRGRGRGV